MKKTIRIFLILFIFRADFTAQVDQSQIENIDDICRDIKKNIASFRKVEKYKDPSGGRYAYLKEKTLKVVVAEASDNVVDKKVEWYFLNGKLIYCEQTWTASVTKKVFNNEKLYVNKDRLVLWLRTDGKPVSPKTGEFMETDNGLISYGKKLVEECAEK